MSTQLIPFQFEAFPIRVVMISGEPWWVAADVCAALEISNNRDALTRLDDDEKGVASTDTLGGKQEMAVINEPGLYSLILGSRKPEAKAFKRWITHEVIPAIRQTGSYTLPKANRATTTDSCILKHRQAKVITSTILSIAKWFGTDAPMARAIAADSVKQQTGIDLQPLLVGNILDDKPVTPTELGKPLGWSGKGTNAHLAMAGLQTRNEDHEWIPTDKGKPYCTCNPYKSPHSDHTGYRVLWYRTVLALLPASEEAA